MPAINFMQRLAPLVESGAKRHTVRRVRKRPIRPGDRLILFTGMRTKACRRLLLTSCTRVQDIQVSDDGTIHLEGKRLGPAAASALARADGLEGSGELVQWLHRRYGLPFRGVVIHWHYVA